MRNLFRRNAPQAAPTTIDPAPPRGIPPLHGDGKLTHRSQLGDVFRFDITKDGATDVYVVTIESEIDYQGRDASAHATHRLSGGKNGQARICFKAANEPRDLRIAMAMAMAWSERTSRYIRDGQSWS